MTPTGRRCVGRGRTAILVSVGMLAALLVPGQAAAAASPFVSADHTRLEIAGTPWFMNGASTYGTSNPGGSQPIGAEVSLALDAGLNTLRIVNVFDERGVDANAPYDEASWERVDHLLAAMSASGLHAILDLSAFRNHLQNRELYLEGSQALGGGYAVPTECAGRTGDDLDRCAGARWCIENPASCTDPYSPARATAWDDFLGSVATRTNTVTGVEYRDDPTIALVSFAGEPNPPNSGEPLKPTTQELTDFYARVFDQWKAYDPNHLVTSGGLLHVDWEELYGGPSGIDYEAIWSLPNQDVLSIHDYFAHFPATAANDTKAWKIATAAATVDKPWITEEFGYLQQPVDGSTTYTESDRGVWFTDLYATQMDPERLGVTGVVPAAGVSFWNLGPEVDPASHDVNPSTAATWAAVQAFSASLAVGVNVTDAGYAPVSLPTSLGSKVEWTFSGSKAHSVTDALLLGPAKSPLFDSGAQASGTYAYRFQAAGTYPYGSTASGDPRRRFKGEVAIPVWAPVGVKAGATFTVTWSSASLPGYVYDVRVRFLAAGTTTWGSWSVWKRRATVRSATFTATDAGTYGLQARLRNASTGKTSRWSPEVTVVVRG
jgi:plastocyanin